MRVRGLVLLVILPGIAVPVAGHVPTFPTDNTTPERAVEVTNPVKSWSFYDELSTGGARYYRLHLDAGERVRVSTFTPRDGPFVPGIVLMSETLNRSETVPAGVRVPDGMGAVVVPGKRPDSASYEPFAPSANFQTSSKEKTIHRIQIRQ